MSSKWFERSPDLVALLVFIVCSPVAAQSRQDSGTNSPEIVLRRAELMVQLGKPDIAEPLFVQVVAQAQVPDLRARALAGQANILSSEGDTEQAAKLFEQAFAQATSATTKVRILVGQAGLGFAGTFSPDDQQKIDLAQKLADDAADPMAQIAVHTMRAVAALAAGNKAEGIRLFGATAALARRGADSTTDPDEKVTFLLFESGVLISQQRWDEALERTRASLAVPASPDAKAQALLLEGAVYQEKGMPVLAKSRFDEARQVTSDLDLRANAFAGRGEVDERTGNFTAALYSYDEGLKLRVSNETRSFLLFKKGTALLKAGRFAEAQSRCSRSSP